MRTKIYLIKLCFLALFLSAGNLVFSHTFQISEINYSLGKTKEYALKNHIFIDTKRIFQTEEELNQYKNYLLQKFDNLRAFETVSIQFEEINMDNSSAENEISNNSNTLNEIKQSDNEPETKISSATGAENHFSDENEERKIVQLNCSITAVETKSLLIVPYPVYNSNSGLQFKLKAKDTNFNGTLQPLSFELAFGKDFSELSEENNYFVSAGLEIDYPINCAPCIAYWNNNYSFNYNFDDNRAQFLTSTGITVEYSASRFSIVFNMNYKISRDFEYTEYGDEIYFSSYKKLAVPVKLIKSEKYGDFIFEPYGELTDNYNLNPEYLKEFASTYLIPFVGKKHINDENDDLSGMTGALGAEFNQTNINWHGNMRKGYSYATGYRQGYNLQLKNFQPMVYTNASLFYCSKYLGFASHFDFFYSKIYRRKIGGFLRGIVDKQKYSGTNKKALKTPSAISVNLDFPIHIITTDWISYMNTIFGEDSEITRKFNWLKTFDFELQISPFIDAALTKNEFTGRLFNYKDGWYSAGVEVLVYPAKWKNIVVRASAGFDVGKKIINKKFPDKLDYSWRENVKDKEIYVGLGLLY